MKIYEKIKDILDQSSSVEEIVEVIFGSCYIAVELKSGALGFAHREGHAINPEGAQESNPEDLAGKGAKEIAQLIGDESIELSAVGVATSCALAQLILKDWDEGDIMEQVDIRKGDRVVMVGNFPITPAIEERGADLKIHDRYWGLGSESEMIADLRDADIAIITGTTLINGTLPEILDGIKQAREVIILGPSTLLLPEAFTDTPVTRLMGVIPKDVSKVKSIIRDGGGTRQFTPFVRKVGVLVRGD